MLIFDETILSQSTTFLTKPSEQEYAAKEQFSEGAYLEKKMVGKKNVGTISLQDTS